jgi:hypothetical protein
VAERSNAAVSKTVSGGFVRRGFKSLPLRLTEKPAGNGGFSVSEFAEFAEKPKPAKLRVAR